MRRLQQSGPLKAGANYYRIKLITGTGYNYTHVVTIYSGEINFEIKSLLNPFDSYLSFDTVAPAEGKATVTLFDGFGRILKQQQDQLYKRSNKMMMMDLGALSEGTYFLRIQTGNQSINKKVIKIKN